MAKQSKLKVGDLCYLKDVGFPYTRTDDGGESWEGASCVVRRLNAGVRKDMVYVETLLPMRVSGRKDDQMPGAYFYPDNVRKENRPWLRAHIRQIIKLRAKLLDFVCTAEEMLR